MKYQYTKDYTSSRLPFINKYIGHLKGTPCSLLEIGVYEGRTTLWLADNFCSHPEAKIICIEPSTNPVILQNIEKCNRKDQIEFRCGRSEVEIPTLHSKFDFVYVDGSHEAKDVLTDWVLIFPLIKSNGIVCFDDYRWKPKRDVVIPPGPAIDCILSLWVNHIKVLYKGNTVWIQKK